MFQRYWWTKLVFVRKIKLKLHLNRFQFKLPNYSPQKVLKLEEPLLRLLEKASLIVKKKKIKKVNINQKDRTMMKGMKRIIMMMIIIMVI